MGSLGLWKTPMTSRVWKVRMVKQLKNCHFQRTDFCQWGLPWRKSTYFLLSDALQPQFRVCSGTQPLFTVAGASCVASRDSERTVSHKDCRTLPFSACECSSQSNLHSNYIADSEVGDGV